MSPSPNKLMRDDRVKSIYGHIVEFHELGIEIFKISPYQYRFVKENHRIDYFPTSSKYHDLNLGKWGYSPAFKIKELFDLSNMI